MPLQRKKQPKKHSATYWRKKCVTWAKTKAKERDGYQCQHCPRNKVQGWQIHGSHILPEGTYPLMSAEPYNIIALCADCHTGGSFPGAYAHSVKKSWHNHPLYFAEWFEKKWPGRYKELNEMAEEKRKHIVNWEKKYNELP